jgi:murein DD-endopeptidase MepM/ murein hydrolase activator NlpD
LTTQLAFPVPGGSLSQFYRAGHEGVDIAAAAGSRVVAAEAGMVVSAGWRNNGGGLVVEIDHANGVNTVYNHLGSIAVVAGQWVGRGQLIGGMGCSGVCYGPHIQFDVRVGGRLVDPMTLF